MARNNTQTSQEQFREAQTPEFLAWHVTQKGDKSFWNKVGAAWAHRDEKGFMLQLDSFPVGGCIVLRQPFDDANDNAAGRS